jgi:IclR helix-turn-helix domain
MEEDPLNELLLDADEVDRSRVTAALKGVVGIDTQTGRLVPRPAFGRLSAAKRILAILLGSKAAVLLNRAEEEELQAREIIAATGLPRGTVHPTLKGLREKRLVSQTEGGAYYVAAAQMAEALEALQGEE